MAELFVVGTWAFWGLVIAESIILMSVQGVDDEAGPAVAVLTLLACLGMLQAWSDVKPFTLIKEDPLSAALFLAAYLVIGGAWSIFKWWRLEVANFREAKDRFMTLNGLTEIMTPDQIHHWNKYKAEFRKRHNERSRPGRWVALWPWSILATAIGDWLGEAVDSVVRLCRSAYDRISDSVWAR